MDAFDPHRQRELFARVWERVAAGESCPVEADPAGPDPTPEAGQERDAQDLCDLVRACLFHARVYRRLALRSARNGAALDALADRKVHHAKRLSAAGFLLTGVRYWPLSSLPPVPPGDPLALLRDRYREEARLAQGLRAWSGRCAPALRVLCRELAEETEGFLDEIRQMVERET